MTNNSDEKQIRMLIQNWAKAVREKDMDGILKHHAKDMIMFDVPAPFQSVGIDAYAKTWDTFYKYTKLGVFDILTMEVFADKNVAFSVAVLRCEDGTGGKGYEPLDFRLTVGLRKIEDQWTIVHEHHSIPAK